MATGARVFFFTAVLLRGRTLCGDTEARHVGQTGAGFYVRLGSVGDTSSRRVTMCRCILPPGQLLSVAGVCLAGN
jgi:hypothetical protein